MEMDNLARKMEHKLVREALVSFYGGGIEITFAEDHSEEDKRGIDGKLTLEDGKEKKIQITQLFIEKGKVIALSKECDEKRQDAEQKLENLNIIQYSRDASGEAVLLEKSMVQPLVSFLLQFLPKDPQKGVIFRVNDWCWITSAIFTIIKFIKPSDEENYAKIAIDIIKKFEQEQKEEDECTVSDFLKALSSQLAVTLPKLEYKEHNNFENYSYKITKDFIRACLKLEVDDIRKLSELLCLCGKNHYVIYNRLQSASVYFNPYITQFAHLLNNEEYDSVEDFIKGECFNYNCGIEGYVQFPLGSIGIYGNLALRYIAHIKEGINKKDDKNKRHLQNGGGADLLFLYTQQTYPLRHDELEAFDKEFEKICKQEATSFQEVVFVTQNHSVHWKKDKA